MSFKIRTKLIIAFVAIIFPLFFIIGIIELYNQNITRKSMSHVKSVSEERLKISNLMFALEKIVMHGNDYIITGDRKHIESLDVVSTDIEKNIKDFEGIVSDEDERKIFKDVKIAWQNIKEISQKIFAIPEPLGNEEAARLMKEMDYRWAYPTINTLAGLREVRIREFKQAAEAADRAWRKSLVIMFAGGGILIALGVFFSFVYSIWFVKPIEIIHKQAESIAEGNFKTRLDIKTGDEIEQLSNAMNEMAAQLDSFYSNLQGMVDERTRELRENVKRYYNTLNNMLEGCQIIDFEWHYLYVNDAAAKQGRKTKEELLGRTMMEIYPGIEDTKMFAVLRRCMDERVPQRIYNEFIYPDSSKAWFDLSIQPVPEGIFILSIEVTELKKTEKLLQESKERYKHLVESVTNYIYTVQIESGRPVSTFHGPGCFTVTGFKEKEYITDPSLWINMVYEEDRPAVIKQINEILSGREVSSLEHRIIHRDGKIRWVSNTMVSYYDEQGRLVAYDGLISDITSRKVAEMMLEHARKEWEITFDSIADPIFIHDRDFKILRANRAYQKMAGMEFMGFIGRPYYEVFPKMEKPFKGCAKELELQQEEEFSCPTTNRIFKIKFYPINGAEGKHLYSVHVMEDITEAKMAEGKIKEGELRYRTIFEQSPAGVLIIDPETFLPIEFNDQACRQLDYSREEFAKLRVMDYEVIETPEEVKARSKKLLREGKDSFETKHRVKNGAIKNVLVTVQKIVLSGKPLFYCVFRDITEIRRAEEKIKTEMEITTHLLMIAEATVHTTDIDKLLKQVMLCGHEIMKCDVCLSYLYDKETKAFRPSQQYGLPHELIPLFMTEPMDEKIEFIKKVLEKGEPLTMPSPQRGENTGEGELFPYLPDVKTVAAIPLFGRKEPLGIIIGIYKGEIEITEREGKIMRGISHQVSTVLEEAILYRESIDRTIELSHKIETIQVMHEIDRNILSTLGMQEIMETSVRLISRVIASCERANVVLVDKGRQGFIYAAGFGTTIVPKGAFVPFEDTSAAEVVKTERTQYIADMRGVKRYLPIEERLFKEGFLSHIRVPLIVKGDVTAVLSIGSKSPSAFTPENLSTLEKIASQIGVALENARLVTDLDELFMGTLRTLSSAIDAKSPWTRGHSERVTQYALSIAREMGLEETALKDIELAGLLHDVGKIGTYESILDKLGKLTDEELKVMRQHPVKGAEILAPIKQMQKLIPAIKYHHEFYDGRGYPEGLKGEAIPFLARILGVADTVDAMGADRPYRKGRSADVIVAELKRCSGTQFDPNVVEAFLKTITKGFIHLQ